MYFLFKGRTFASVIQEYFEVCPNTKEFIKIYETEKGRKEYEETLSVVEKQFPQYVKELQGIADGSKMPFHVVLYILIRIQHTNKKNF